MADEADMAQVRIDMDLELAIRAARGVMPVPGISAPECAECGEPIPDARRLAIPGVDTCRDCADARESRLRRGL